MYLNYHNAKLHMGLWLRLVAWEYYFLVSILVFPDLCLTRIDFHNNEICREYVDKRQSPTLILSIRLALQSISTPSASLRRNCALAWELPYPQNEQP